MTTKYLNRRPTTRLTIFLLLVAVVLAASPVQALLSIDFELPYYVHPDWQVWDFCLVEHDGTYHIFYHAIPKSFPVLDGADFIWHATSEDLRHWSPPEQILTVSDDPWESYAIWAPDVVYDDASGLWWMAYTGVDDLINQRICMAYSADLMNWEKATANPVFELAPPTFVYDAAAGWSACRDPYLYRENDQWHMLVAGMTVDSSLSHVGAFAHATSPDLLQWANADTFLVNDGEFPVHPLESGQYKVVTGGHHMFFHEYAFGGISHVATTTPGEWTFDDRIVIDHGVAPEVDSFDGGENWMLSRIGPFLEPDETVFSYVVRVDTLTFRQAAYPPTVYRSPPLARDWEVYSGNMCLGNPCFGDNPARRGEDPAMPVGNFFFGSKEYFQGPLSSRGDVGRELGDPATGFMKSYPFVIEGDSITLLVGGPQAPSTCFVALMDAATDTVLRREVGLGSGTMTQRVWDVTELQGTEAYIYVEDSDYFAHINIDEIHEVVTATAIATEPPSPRLITDRGPQPNPFNPRTSLRFDLKAPASCRASVYDLAGRLIWRSGVLAGQPGANRVDWHGQDVTGQRVAGGTYVYRVVAGTTEAISGKLTLVP